MARGWLTIQAMAGAASQASASGSTSGAAAGLRQMAVPATPSVSATDRPMKR